ncbi:Protein of unknown function [Gryllus bimaculatus]|nr:Protein of unknown function [Gryllus bimaculatus]
MDLKRVCGRTDLLETSVLWEAPSFTSQDSAPGEVFPAALPSASGHSAAAQLGGARSASAPALQCMERQSPRPGVTLPVAGGRQLRLTSSTPSLSSLPLGPGAMAGAEAGTEAGVEAGTVAGSSPSQPSAPAGAASPVAAPPETAPRTPPPPPPPPAPAPQASPRAQGEPAQQGSGARQCNH